LLTFIFVAMSAMADPVEISISGEYTADDTTTTETDERLVIKLTYSVEPNPKPTADDLTFAVGIPSMAPSVPLAEGDDNDPKTYFINWVGDITTAIGNSENPVFILRGYELIMVTALEPVTLAYIGIPILAQPTPMPTDKLVPNSGYVPGLGYAIVVADKTAAVPTLPANSSPYEILKVDWSEVSDESMPNLWTLFQGGGTLNLRVNVPGTTAIDDTTDPPTSVYTPGTNRLGSKTADNTYDENHGRNQRQLVINEVMWAEDESFVGDATRVVQEQWIEIYNRTTSPIAFNAAVEVAPAPGTAAEDLTYFSDIKFTTSNAFPGPKPETDMLSNVPFYDLTWDIDSKGQHGSSATPRREFKSMQRVNDNNGWEPAHWDTASVLFLRNYRGTPGKPNQATRVPTARTRPNRDTPAKNKIIINEIGNLADDTSDWIELRNVSDTDQSLQNWVLTKTTGYGNETEIVRFPDYTIPARGVLLLVNRDPIQTLLSVGYDITQDANNQAFGAGPQRYLVVGGDKLEIPNDDKWLLILRSNKPWDVGGGRNVYETGYRVEDAAGPGALHADFRRLDLRSGSPAYEKKSDGKADGDIWETKVFPLNGNTQADADFLQSDRLNEAGKVWVRDGSKQGYLKDAWTKIGFTGIGYDRRVAAEDQYGGTPGYPNDVARGKISQLDGGKLIVSELMLTTSNNRLTQWIELYNTSKTRGIDLAADSSEKSEDQTGWQLIIENHDSGSWKENKRNLNITVNLKDLFTYIPPNQIVLIAASEGRPSDRDHLPDARVASIFQELRNKFSMASRRDPILNAEGGFYIRIVDGDGTVSDEVGNLDGNPPNPRQGIGIDDPYSWNWSTALTEEGDRTSLIRLRDANGRPRVALPNRNVEGDLTGAVLPLGMKGARPPKYAWVHAVDTAFTRVPKIWYGESKDISTPGFVRGIQLPVSLSFFRATLENGEVVIRWTTESELDNAGFNILRSQRKDGEYKQINTTLIQGAGTTGERNTYKWVDPTAKAGVVYYYQIEDVSFAGEHNVLTTSRLKGYISAKNKLTTTWSELKSSR
ncbi:lamin tail domain-containing protein, partial [Candidatus Poribacteria bacterium]|nr:lamin tail domain-containing protein [Candidatus Poribacteria bacterium]